MSGLIHIDNKFKAESLGNVLKLEPLFQLFRLTFTQKGSVIAVGGALQTFSNWKKMKPALQLNYLGQCQEMAQSSNMPALKKIRPTFTASNGTDTVQETTPIAAGGSTGLSATLGLSLELHII